MQPKREGGYRSGYSVKQKKQYLKQQEASNSHSHIFMGKTGNPEFFYLLPDPPMEDPGSTFPRIQMLDPSGIPSGA